MPVSLSELHDAVPSFTLGLKMEDDPIVRVKRLVAELQELVALARLRMALKKFDPNEPRWPSGAPDSQGERWKRSDDVVLVAGKVDQRRDAMCEEQCDRDSDLCRMSGSQLCWQTAMQRRAACLAGDDIPQLKH